jgi:microcystin-dependent protein
VDAVELLYRIAKGQPLTDLELDDNFRKLKTAVNYLLEEIASSPTTSAIRGEMKMFGGASLPTGYLWCNGAAVSRVTYADLFAVVGTKFGAGNGTTTFNLPDFRGASPMGSNPMGAVTKVGVSARTDGAIVGAETANANHTHTASGVLEIDPIDYTPSGTISVANYTGNVIPTITTTVETTEVLTTPSGTVTINNYTGSATPTITTTVNSVTLSTTPSGTIESTTVLSSTSPTINIDGEACSLIRQNGEGTTVNMMDCVDLTVDTDTIVGAIGATTTSTFTGASANLNHAHTATSSSTAVSLTHGHTGSFSGVESDLSHSHTAESSSSTISLNHGHSATFTGGGNEFSPTGSASITVDSATLNVSTIQPSQVCNFIIKY